MITIISFYFTGFCYSGMIEEELCLDLIQLYLNYFLYGPVKHGIIIYMVLINSIESKHLFEKFSVYSTHCALYKKT